MLLQTPPPNLTTHNALPILATVPADQNQPKYVPVELLEPENLEDALVADDAGPTVPNTPIAPPAELHVATPVLGDTEAETPELEASALDFAAPIKAEQPVLTETSVAAAPIAAPIVVPHQLIVADVPLDQGLSTAPIVDADTTTENDEAPDRQAKPAAIAPQAAATTEAQPDRILAPTPAMTTATPVDGNEAPLPTQDLVDGAQTKATATAQPADSVTASVAAPEVSAAPAQHTSATPVQSQAPEAVTTNAQSAPALASNNTPNNALPLDTSPDAYALPEAEPTAAQPVIQTDKLAKVIETNAAPVASARTNAGIAPAPAKASAAPVTEAAPAQSSETAEAPDAEQTSAAVRETATKDAPAQKAEAPVVAVAQAAAQPRAANAEPSRYAEARRRGPDVTSTAGASPNQANISDAASDSATESVGTQPTHAAPQASASIKADVNAAPIQFEQQRQSTTNLTPDAEGDAIDRPQLRTQKPLTSPEEAAKQEQSERAQNPAAVAAARKFASVMAQQPPASQVAFAIARNAGDAPDSIRINLFPDELGQVEILLDVHEDRRAEVVVRAERPETAEMLQRDARELQRALQMAGLDVGSNDLSFEQGESRGKERFSEGEGSDDRTAAAEDDDSINADAFAPLPPRWQTMTPGGVDMVA